MKTKSFEYGIKKYGTPLYVFNIDEMRNRVAFVRNILGKETGICFAMKANSFITEYLAEETDRIEACSMGEFEILRQLGVLPQKILLSGVLKEKNDICRALYHYGGKCLYTVESMNQFLIFAQWCSENKVEIEVFLRLTSKNQFGMDEETIKDLISIKNKCPYLKIRGIHYFSGTQKKLMEKVEKELVYLDGFLTELEDIFGCKINELEYGPGLPVSYFEQMEEGFASMNKSTVDNIKTVAHAISKMKWQGKITLEMGRYLSADCGYYLTGVKDLKRNCGKNYCIVDGGIHQLNYDGQIRGMYIPKLRVSRTDESVPLQEYCICGSLCTVNDVIIKKLRTKELRVGDTLIFEQAGAYSATEGMALFLSHELPQVALYDSNMGWRLARKRQETYKWNMEEKKNADTL